MKPVFCCLALGALFALNGTAGDSGSPLRIYTDFRIPPPQAIESRLESEVASLVAPIGLAVEWRSLAAPRYGEASVALVVVTFLGRCDTEGLLPRHGLPGPLAWTHITNGEILPFVDVDCEHVRELLQTKLLQMEARTRETLFARALARVLGHELYHVFSETKHHNRDGVTQPGFTAGELLSDNFEFSEREFRSLVTSKLRAILSFRKPYGDRAPRNGQEEYTVDGCGFCHGPEGRGTRRAPAIRGKSLDPKALASHFGRKREDMYRLARNLKLSWQFPSDEEVAKIVAALESGVD